MTATPPTITSLQEYVAHIAAELNLEGVEPLRVTDGTPLVDHGLELDSFQLLELLVVNEELGVVIPEEVMGEVATIGDLYRYFDLKVRSS
jgi:acyl carrier protein